jgi:hypothetical protein
VEIYSISIFSGVNKNIIIPFVMGEKIIPAESTRVLTRESKLPGGKSSLEALVTQAKKHGNPTEVDKFTQSIADTEKSLVKYFVELKASNIFRILSNAFNIVIDNHLHPSVKDQVLKFTFDLAPYGLLIFDREKRKNYYAVTMGITPGITRLNQVIAGNNEIELEKNFIKSFGMKYLELAWSSRIAVLGTPEGTPGREQMKKFFKKITPESTEEEVKNMLMEIIKDTVMKNPEIYSNTILYGATEKNVKKLREILNIDDREHKRAIIAGLYPGIGVTPNFSIKTNKL